MSDGIGIEPIIARLAATPDVEAGMRDAAADICKAFQAERLTLYLVGDDGKSLVSRLHTGLDPVSDFKLPLEAGVSVAGYAARYAKLVNLGNAYDEKELAAFVPPLKFLRTVDQRTGFRTRELLTAPVLTSAGGLLGVLQLLNRLDKQPFPRECELALGRLCQAISATLGKQAQQKADLRREIETLRILAESGMSEDAPEANARARDELLQKYRARFAENRHLDLGHTAPMAMYRRSGLALPAEWIPADYAALEWVCRLADAGHAGAARLLDRVLDGESLDEQSASAKAMQQLGRKSPRVARFLAKKEGERAEPNLRALTDWLDLGGTEAAGLAAGVRELYSWPSHKEVVVLRRLIEQAGRRARPWSEAELRVFRAELFREVAELRLADKTVTDKASAQRLLKHAAELGSRRAASALWWKRFDNAPDSAVFLREWLADSPEPGAQDAEVCMVVGAQFELGTIGNAPDPDAAIRWYASALGLAGVRKGATGAFEPAACFAIARAFDFRNEGSTLVHKPALALAWYGRGLAAGSAACLGAWLSGCETGRMGLAPDSAAALERVQRWLAAGGDAQSRDRQLAAARDLVRHRGQANVPLPGSSLADPAIGAKWLHIGALLGDPESQFRLANLYARGYGVARDPQAGRKWMEKAAAGGYARAAAALTESEQSGTEKTDGLLDLAEMYLDRGDIQFARDMLDEALFRGNEAQQERAGKLFAVVASKTK